MLILERQGPIRLLEVVRPLGEGRAASSQPTGRYVACDPETLLMENSDPHTRLEDASHGEDRRHVDSFLR